MDSFKFNTCQQLLIYSETVYGYIEGSVVYKTVRTILDKLIARVATVCIIFFFFCNTNLLTHHKLARYKKIEVNYVRIVGVVQIW